MDPPFLFEGLVAVEHDFDPAYQRPSSAGPALLSNSDSASIVATIRK
jgi:hypothetical protein